MKEEDTVPHLQHPVPETVLTRIGDITVSFALLEWTIQGLVSSLLGRGQRAGHVIIAEVSFRNLRALAVNLYEERNGRDEEYQDLCGLLKRAEALEITRNQITHSVWAAGGGADTVTRAKTTASERVGLRFKFECVSAEKLEEVCRDLKTLAFDIQACEIKLIVGGKASNEGPGWQ